MQDNKPDFLIILNAFFTNFKDRPNEAIEINWCSYDITSKSVNAESSFLIKPDNFQFLDQNYLSKNGIDFDQLSTSRNLESILETFFKYIQGNYIKNNISFAFITKDDELLGCNGKLTKEAQGKSIYIDYLSRYFNLINEFRHFYKTENIPSNGDLNEILQFLSLKKTEVGKASLMELNTMVRIVNRLIKDGHQFILSENINNFIHSPVKMQIENLPNKQNLPLPSQEGLWKVNKLSYLRLKNIDITFCNKKDLISLFYLYGLKEEQISISFDIFGRKTGEACIQIYHTADYREILSSFKFKNYNNTLIDAVESSEQDFLNCLENEKFSEFPYKETNGNIFLKLKNLPTSYKEETIKQLFTSYIISENGIKMYRNRKGYFFGDAVISFANSQSALKALKEKNETQVTNQYISLEQSSLDEYEEFASSNSFYNTIKIMSDLVISEQVPKSLFINILPLNITQEKILKIFEMFNINDSNLIFDKKILSNYGSLIVCFYSEEDAEMAKKYLNNFQLKWEGRSRKLQVENLLFLVNKGNES